MERTLGYLLGAACGIAIGVIAVILITKWTHKDKKIKCSFDERQELAIGRGAKYGFYTLMIYNFLYGAIDTVVTKKFVDNALALFVGILIAAIVYISYCIWEEAYFSLNENPQKVMIAFVIIAIINLALFGMNAAGGNLIKDGMIQYGVANLLCGLLFVVIFVELWAKSHFKKREEES